MASVPNFLVVYQKYATRLTNLENHKHQSTYDYSLTIKRFALSAVVAYLGLTLSAFVYVPFGEQIMTYVHSQLSAQPGLNETAEAVKDAASAGIWEHDVGSIATSINTTRLQNQMYAYTVTNQIVGTFLEVGLPYIMQFLGRAQGGAATGNGKAKGKRVDFQDESSGGAELSATSGGERKGERELLVRIRKEVALGREYNVFEDYIEMVTQFGYVVIWSTIWPLAPGASLSGSLRVDFLTPRLPRSHGIGQQLRRTSLRRIQSREAPSQAHPRPDGLYRSMARMSQEPHMDRRPYEPRSGLHVQSSLLREGPGQPVDLGVDRPCCPFGQSRVPLYEVGREVCCREGVLERE